MHFYWRIQQDLREIGNVLIFHNPALIRAFEQWVKKNKTSLAAAEGLTWEDMRRLCLNPN